MSVATVALLRYNGKPALMPVVMDPERAPVAAETAQRVGRCGQSCCFVAAEGQGLQAHLAPATLPSYCVWRQRPGGPTVFT